MENSYDEIVARNAAVTQDAIHRILDRHLDPPAETLPCFTCAVGDVRSMLTNELTRWYVPEDKADALFSDETVADARDLIREFGGPWEPCSQHR